MRMFFFVLTMLFTNATHSDVIVGHPSVTAKLAIKNLEAKQFIADSKREEKCLNLFSENKWLMEYRGMLYRHNRYPGYFDDPEVELSSSEFISLRRALSYDCFAFLSDEAGSEVSPIAPSTIILIE